MSLFYKEDWEEAKERYRMWWNGEYFGRCGLWITASEDEARDLLKKAEKWSRVR